MEGAGDLVGVVGAPLAAVVGLIGLAAVGGAAALRSTYGTSNPLRAWQIRKRQEEYRQTIRMLEEARESLMFHIGWAEDRGDHSEAQTLRSQLADYEIRIQDTIAEMRALTGEQLEAEERRKDQ